METYRHTRNIISLLLCFLPVLFFACEEEEAASDEDEDLLEYIETTYTDNDIKVDSIADGLYYVKTRTGIGDLVEEGDDITISYEASLIDGTVFSTATVDDPFSFEVGTDDVIEGLAEGVQVMREGESGILIIHSDLGYGEIRTGPIPAYSTLIFELIIISID